MLFDNPTVRSVTEFTEHIRNLLENEPTLYNVWVRGEVSNFTKAASGHWYFTLKDNNAQLKCVLWRSAAANQPITPRNGDALEVFGRVTVYTPRGEYQLQAERIRPVGIGDLYARFEELKSRLAEEGLFDQARKRPLPYFPQRIGVVTSPDAAAFQDVQNVLRRRFPLGEIVLSPTPVQGADAPPQIVRALQRLNRYGEVDVILLCRGGGSLEDLWAFNDERVARAVATSEIPVITGVGHEVDFTMVDFVSDYRAPTPSAAAEVLTQYCAVDDLRERVREIQHSLELLLTSKIDTLRDEVQTLSRTMQYSSPDSHIRTMRQRIDTHNLRMTSQLKTRLLLLRERLSAREAALNTANPLSLLERGYALVTQPDGTPLRSVNDAPIGSAVMIQLHDGRLAARVESQSAVPKVFAYSPLQPNTQDTPQDDDDTHGHDNPTQRPLF